MYKYLFFLISFSSLLVVGCAPDRDDVIQLPSPADAPDFSIEPVEGDSNRFIIRDLSDGNFQRLWDLPGGAPTTSSKAVDTVFYNKAGDYTITLFVSKSDGSGTPYTAKKVTVLIDAPLVCGPKLAILTGDCAPEGKCWTLSHEAGAVRVGPTYDDYSWFTSTENGLQDAQYDDGFCFTFEGAVYQNKNNGASVNPWDGYQVQALDPGISTFIFQEGTGINNRDQIIITDDQFMGVMDADNVMDVITLTETELVVRMRIRAQDGTPNAEGWFELTFVPQL